MTGNKGAKRCERCAMYGAYYRPGCWRFWKKKHGRCSLSGEYVEENGGCSNFMPFARKEVTAEAIDGAITDVKRIVELLELL